MESQAEALRELGRRLSRRRRESGLDIDALAARTAVPARLIEGFEQGQGELGAGALTRLASALGVAPTAFLHTSAPQERAPVEPGVLLKGRSVGASLSPKDRESLARGLQKAQAFSLLGDLLRVERLAEGFHPKSAPTRNAHRAGYASALQVRALLPERQGPLRGLARLVEGRFDILVLRHRFEQASVLGASCRSGRARLIVISTRIEREPVYRFVLAHELAHQLLDLSDSGITTDEGRFETSGFWMENPPEEKRANAFAAMLLAPEEAVRRELGPSKAEGYGLTDAKALVTRARTRFGLSFPAMAWHLYNLRYFRSAETVEALLTTPDEAPLTGFEEESRFDGLERRTLEAHSRELISASRARELLGGSLEELSLHEAVRGGYGHPGQHPAGGSRGDPGRAGPASRRHH
ncbi:ImmA/IrrE family metallo-endopeptidase [Pyxidicoccus caerfyrddinensis]|uniref:ImmA/IrrE family metallo-endopeptidase n=1 Tax=Pyxidicoccus caerfyrddinensis TaxID=2709663 RepID=UPI0013DAF6D6|nr:ImmA/IrrE family metallo-endopeptidase [Pyxidicoccus caerfyrddinensis]